MEQKGTENIAELVRKALAGDTESFSVLVRQYQNYAYGVAIGVLADFELARDVAQEAFLLAYRDLKKLQDPARFGGWLRGIVRRMWSERKLRQRTVHLHAPVRRPRMRSRWLRRLLWHVPARRTVPERPLRRILRMRRSGMRSRAMR